MCARFFARTLPFRLLEHILWVGIDVRGMARPRSRTSADRSAKPRASSAGVQQTGDVWMAVLNGGGLAPHTEQVDLRAESSNG